MTPKRFVPPTLSHTVRLYDEEGLKPEVIGRPLWFYANSAVMISERNYYGPGRDDHHVYKLDDGRRKYPPKYLVYRIRAEDLEGLREVRRLSSEMDKDERAIDILAKALDEFVSHDR